MPLGPTIVNETGEPFFKFGSEISIEDPTTAVAEVTPPFSMIREVSITPVSLMMTGFWKLWFWVGG